MSSKLGHLVPSTFGLDSLSVTTDPDLIVCRSLEVQSFAVISIHLYAHKLAMLYVERWA